MSKKNKNIKEEEVSIIEESLHSADELAQGSEKFIEKNAKSIAIIFGLILLGVFVYFAYLKFVVDPKEEKAFKEFVAPQNAILKDSLDLALGGKSGTVGFEDIKTNFKGTNAANLSSFYSGKIYFEKGEFQKALDNYNEFSTDDELLNAVKEGAKGDCYVGLNNNEEALKQFKKATGMTNNPAISAIFARKGAVLSIQLQKNQEALDFLEGFKSRFAEEYEQDKEMQAYVEMLKTKNGNN